MTRKAFLLLVIIWSVLWGCFGGANAEPEQDETVAVSTTPVPTPTPESTPVPTPTPVQPPVPTPTPETPPDYTPTPVPPPIPTPTPDPTPDDNQPPIDGSVGCGNRNYPQSGTFIIDIDGTRREYIVSLPGNYDPNTAYRLVFAWHQTGGSAEEIAFSNFYGLELLADDTAIFVAGQGLTYGIRRTGWYNAGGRDVAFARGMYDRLSNDYCVNVRKVFSTGMGVGGTLSNTLGCVMGNVFRAVAPMSGSEPEANPSECIGQVAVWISQGSHDRTISFASGEDGLDYWLAENECSSDVDDYYPVSPAPCVAYEGCQEGYPVYWCEFDGGHEVPPFAAEAIWNFFIQF